MKVLRWLTSSLVCLDQARLQTWDPVSVHCRGWPVSVFQKRMQRSAVPPPEASRPCWWGDQAMAFTAAKCSVYCCTGRTLEWFHTSSYSRAAGQHQGRSKERLHSGLWREESRNRGGTSRLHTLLSFPPEASNWWSVLHLRPQTSCLCPWRRRSDWRGGALMSRCKITRSRLPDDSWSAFHANAPDKELEWRNFTEHDWCRMWGKAALKRPDNQSGGNFSTHPLLLCALQVQRASSPLTHPRSVHNLYESPPPPGYPNHRWRAL